MFCALFSSFYFSDKNISHLIGGLSWKTRKTAMMFKSRFIVVVLYWWIGSFYKLLYLLTYAYNSWSNIWSVFSYFLPHKYKMLINVLNCMIAESYSGSFSSSSSSRLSSSWALLNGVAMIIALVPKRTLDPSAPWVVGILWAFVSDAMVNGSNASYSYSIVSYDACDGCWLDIIFIVEDILEELRGTLFGSAGDVTAVRVLGDSELSATNQLRSMISKISLVMCERREEKNNNQKNCLPWNSNRKFGSQKKNRTASANATQMVFLNFDSNLQQKFLCLHNARRVL